MRFETVRIVDTHARSSRFALAAVVVGAFSLGLSVARQTMAKSDGAQQTGNRQESQKHWASAQEIKDRFSTPQHEAFMRRAIANSRLAGVEKRTGGVFGAVIVDRSGQVIADGQHLVVDNFDPTWHAEINAIRVACAKLRALKLDGCVIYTSAEPCPMCLATCY